jgi:hypothetical protein
MTFALLLVAERAADFQCSHAKITGSHPLIRRLVEAELSLSVRYDVRITVWIIWSNS